MSTLSIDVMGWLGVMSFNGDFANPAFRIQRGFRSVFIQNGTGDWTFFLTSGVNLQTEAIVLGVCESSVPADVVVEVLSTTSIRVRTNDSGGSADIPFWLVIGKVGPN